MCVAHIKFVKKNKPRLCSVTEKHFIKTGARQHTWDLFSKLIITVFNISAIPELLKFVVLILVATRRHLPTTNTFRLLLNIRTLFLGTRDYPGHSHCQNLFNIIIINHLLIKN